jgi:hypothetical protein
VRPDCSCLVVSAARGVVSRPGADRRSGASSSSCSAALLSQQPPPARVPSAHSYTRRTRTIEDARQPAHQASCRPEATHTHSVCLSLSVCLGARLLSRRPPPATPSAWRRTTTTRDDTHRQVTPHRPDERSPMRRACRLARDVVTLQLRARPAGQQDSRHDRWLLDRQMKIYSKCSRACMCCSISSESASAWRSRDYARSHDQLSARSRRQLGRAGQAV